jgi:hypothetical protein
MKDITDFKKLEDELEEENLREDEFNLKVL